MTFRSAREYAETFEPLLFAECAAIAADRFENARLAAALLREVASVDPAEYKRQQLSDAVGVRCVGVFISELAERMPKTTMTNISLLLPHLDGEAYSLRSSLVTVLGELILIPFRIGD